MERGLGPRIYSAHSLRRTKVTLIYRRTKNLRGRATLVRPHEDREHGPLPRHRADDALGIAEQIDV